jgi:hypothetical protein
MLEFASAWDQTSDAFRFQIPLSFSPPATTATTISSLAPAPVTAEPTPTTRRVSKTGGAVRGLWDRHRPSHEHRGLDAHVFGPRQRPTLGEPILAVDRFVVCLKICDGVDHRFGGAS